MWRYYRQLVPLREQSSSQPLDQTLALLGHLGFEGVGIFVKLNFVSVPSNKNLQVDETVLSNKEFVDGTVLSNKELVDGTVQFNK